MNSDKDPWKAREPGNRQRRKATRVSVSDRDDCLVFINGKAYLINDLSLSSIGLLLLPVEAFTIGEIIGDVLMGCRLEMAGRSIRGLEYRIVHISPGRGNYMICGLEWVNKDTEKESLINSTIQNLKSDDV